jgi:hypothetical protein
MKHLFYGLLVVGLICLLFHSPNMAEGGATEIDPIQFQLAPTKGISFVTNPCRTSKKHQPETMVSGVALFDFDKDGRVDAVVTALNPPMVIFHNTSPKPNHWLGIKTIGTKSNRDGMGAKIKILSASGSQFNHVNTAAGYGCASSPEAHFGLGPDSSVKSIQITWPSGTVQTLEGIKADQVLTIKEP